ncbi:MAG: hydrogenase maturation protease [Candidatus Aminicenantes bacterium]|nr:hydrogenase maturation protease [Candidatus Aminicenantes bacterium]
MKTLIIGIGNPGRGDDGLGPALVERLAEVEKGSLAEGAVVEAPGGISAVWKYQLNIEDAHLIKDFDAVVFADAAIDGESVRLAELTPAAAITFTTHELSPGAVLALADELYGKAPAGWLLSMPGRDWELGAGLSEPAGEQLDKAEALLREWLAKDRNSV